MLEYAKTTLTWRIEDTKKEILEIKEKLKKYVDGINTEIKFDAEVIAFESVRLVSARERLEELTNEKRAIEFYKEKA